MCSKKGAAALRSIPFETVENLTAHSHRGGKEDGAVDGGKRKRDTFAESDENARGSGENFSSRGIIICIGSGMEDESEPVVLCAARARRKIYLYETVARPLACDSREYRFR